jgi:hypothetical protein
MVYIGYQVQNTNHFKQIKLVHQILWYRDARANIHDQLDQKVQENQNQYGYYMGKVLIDDNLVHEMLNMMPPS